MKVLRTTEHTPSMARAILSMRCTIRSQTLFAIAWLTASSAAMGTEVRAVRIDGTPATGTWLGSPNGRSLQLRVPDGPLTLRWDDLSRVEFLDATAGQHTKPAGSARRDPKHPKPRTTSVTFHLADGGRLFGALLEPKKAMDKVLGVTAIGRSTSLPFDRLAAVELASPEDFPLAHKVFEAALASRQPGEDILIIRERPAFPGSDDTPQTQPPRPAEPAKSVAGRLVSLGPNAGSFVFADRERSFQVGRVYGIVLATGVWNASSPKARRDYPIRVELVDGSTFTGRIERADGESVHIATSLNVSATLGVDDITALTIASERVVHVGDLKPVAQKTSGILYRSWMPRFNQNVSGGPISLARRVYTSGLGVHSRTELTFAIDAAFETFVATIGIDDSVRPRGNVVFRVVGDERMLYDSGPVTGKDEPIDIRVDVADVKRLRLVVDFGEGLDLADQADWADARLLKPAPTTDAKTN